jgi:crotonobetainyl-CoA:carnitine CoA-transferase CaiB-like acyl-CoA transferase
VVECVPSDVLENPQLDARHLWANLNHHELGGALAHPKHFFLCSATENYIKRPSPSIGQDNDDIYVKELGLSSAELASLKEADVI